MPDKYISPIRQEIEKRKKQQSSSSNPSAVSSAYVSPIRQEINKRREETKQARAMSPNEQGIRAAARKTESALNKAGKSLIPASSKLATQSKASRIEAKMNSMFESPSNPAAKPAPAKTGNWFTDVQRDIYNSTLKPVQDFTSRVAARIADPFNIGPAVMPKAPHVPEFVKDTMKPAQTTSEKTADIVGNIAGLVAPTGLAYKTGGKLAGKVASNLGNKALPTLKTSMPKVAQALKHTATGAGAGAAYGIANETADSIFDTRNDGSQSLAQRAGNVSLEATLFGSTDGLLNIAGHALKGTGIPQKAADLFQRFTQRNKPVETTHPLLALPAPKEIMAQNPEAYKGWKPLTPYDDAVGKEINQWAGVNRQYEPVRQTTTETINRLARPKPLGDLKLVNPAERQLASLYKLAEENGAPPGREYEYLQDLWSSVAPKEAGSFDNLIEQATKTRSMDEIVSSMKQHISEMDKYGFSPLDALKGRVKRTPEVHTTTRITNPDPNFQLRGGPMVPVGKPYTVKSTKELLAESKPQVAEAKPLNVPNAAEVVAPAAKLQEAAQKLKNPSPEMKERGFSDTLHNSEKPPEGFKEHFKSMYTRTTNAEAVARANKRVSEDIKAAQAYVLGAKKPTPEHVATAFRLIDEFNKQRDFHSASIIAEKYAEAGTKAGQTVQAFSIYDRLSPEGILVHAKRMVKEINDKMPGYAKPVEVTDEMAAKLTDLAYTVQKMNGTKEEANNVMQILEKAKTGEKLTEIETQQIKNFVKDAKQFVSGAEPKPKAPKPPKEIKDKRVRDNVVSFLEAQEQAALKRIREKKNQLNAIPVDLYADYALVGAIKLGKKGIQFADWSEQMVKQFGEDIKPHLKAIYEKATALVDSEAKKISSRKMSEVERLTEQVIRNKEISEKEAKLFRDMARQVSGLSGAEKTTASQDLQAVLQGLQKATFLQKVSTTQAIAQLFNPKTMVRNVLGNEMFYRIDRISKYIATPIDWTRVKLFGGQRSVTFNNGQWGNGWEGFFRPTKDYAEGLITGGKAGARGVNPDGISTQYDLRPNTFNNKWNPMMYLERTLGATLKGFDHAGYKRAVQNTLGEMAHLDAINKKIPKEARKAHIEQFIRNADENLLGIADQYGKYVTFQDNNALSSMLTGVKRALNFKQDWGVGDMIIKYPKTPGALIMRAIEYSPAGVLRSVLIATGPIRKNAEPNTPEAMMALSRAITGTMGLTALGYYFADVGIITGAASKDKDVKDLQNQIGEGPYKVNISALTRWATNWFDRNEAQIQEGDTLVSYDWAQPLAIAISMGANANKSVKEGANGGQAAQGLGETFYTSLDAGLGTIVEQSVLRGIKDAVSSYNPDEGPLDKLARISGNVPASFVPTLSNQIRQVGDNTKRMTYDPNAMTDVKKRVLTKIPGLSKNLPAEYSTLGDKKEVYQDGSNSLVNVFLNPSFVSKYKLSPEAKLVVDLIKETGDKNAAPRSPDKTISIKGNKYKLTAEELSQLQRRQGEETLKRLQRLNPNASNEAKLKRVAKLLEEAGKKARKEIEREHPEIQRKR